MAFKDACQITAANDIDFSVRSAAVGGQSHPVTWSTDTHAGSALFVYSFDASCHEIGLPQQVAPGGRTVAFPAGTVYVGVSSQFFVNLNWTLF
jgi:hypothetical protein